MCLKPVEVQFPLHCDFITAFIWWFLIPKYLPSSWIVPQRSFCEHWHHNGIPWEAGSNLPAASWLGIKISISNMYTSVVQFPILQQQRCTNADKEPIWLTIFPSWFKFDAYLIVLSSVYNQVIVTNFCILHHSCAVMLCTKVCINMQGSFCKCTQPMRDNVTFKHHLSLAGGKNKMIPEYGGQNGNREKGISH